MAVWAVSARDVIVSGTPYVDSPFKARVSYALQVRYKRSWGNRLLPVVTDQLKKHGLDWILFFYPVQSQP